MGWGALDNGVCLLFWKLHRSIARCEEGRPRSGHVSLSGKQQVCAGPQVTDSVATGVGMDAKVIQAVHATGLAGPGLIDSGREQRPWLVVWVSVKRESGGHLHPRPPAGGDVEV